MNAENVSGIEKDGRAAPVEAKPEDVVVDHFSLRQQNLRLIQVNLRDQTDACNEVVHEREWLLHSAECGLALQGNLFAVEDVLTGAGRVVIKEAPLPHVRPNPCAADLRVTPRGDSGFDFDLVAPPDDAGIYPFVQLEYEGGRAGRIRVLQQYQRSRRPATPAHRIPCLVSNTWGDRSRDGRLGEDFIVQEIEAAVRLGVEAVQIDDGWQAGTSSNSVQAAQRGGLWEGFWNANPEFWKPNPERFPRGLEPLAKKAREAGVELGLWFVPDSWNHFVHWDKDAACILNLHRALGVRHIKIDGVNIRHHTAQQNLRRFFDRVLRESGGEVSFDLDITAQNRPGYFGAMDVGTLFVENRYTDWHRYWPHHTLRNLWKLSSWVDPLRLRMEWLNISRNAQNYAGDPLAPSLYEPDAVFATVMFSNPLGWFEVSNLPASYFEKAAPLIRIWKEHRERLFTGTLLPLGSAPDGSSWTGFASVNDEGREGYVLAFRELSEWSEWSFCVPGVKGNVECELLSGDGRLAGCGNGFTAVVDRPLGYVFGRFSAGA